VVMGGQCLVYSLSPTHNKPESRPTRRRTVSIPPAKMTPRSPPEGPLTGNTGGDFRFLLCPKSARNEDGLSTDRCRCGFRSPIMPSDKLGAGNQGRLIRKDPDLACACPKLGWAIRILYGHACCSVAHFHDRRRKQFTLTGARDYAVDEGAERICR